MLSIVDLWSEGTDTWSGSVGISVCLLVYIVGRSCGVSFGVHSFLLIDRMILDV